MALRKNTQAKASDRVAFPTCRCAGIPTCWRSKVLECCRLVGIIMLILAMAGFVILGIAQPGSCSPESDAAFAQGMSSYSARAYAEAAKHFEVALAQGNGSLDCYHKMGKAYAAYGNKAEAARVFRLMESIFRGGGGEQIAKDELRDLGASNGYIGTPSSLNTLSTANSVKSFAKPSTPRTNDQYFNHGMRLLKGRHFHEARKYFDYRISRAPHDHEAHYYKAMCHHYLGDKAKAKEAYAHVVMNFPGSNSAELASAHLRKLSPGTDIALLAKAGGPSVSLVTSASSIPNETRVYFHMDGAQIMLPGKINGRDFEFKFDTGAYGVLIKKEDFDKAQLHIPEKAASVVNHGIGGAIQTKEFDADVTVSGITKRVQINVTEDKCGHNLLGQGWLEDMEYEFDHKSNFITFRPSKTNDVSKDKFAVPFRLHGKHLVVDVTIPGGKKTPMVVDTGAYGIMFTQKNFNDLDLTIPIASSRMTSHGVGESTRDQWDFFIDELRLGPIVVQEPKVSVVDHLDDACGGKDDIGLLGMGFFGGWRYTIDNKNQVLRFFH